MSETLSYEEFNKKLHETYDKENNMQNNTIDDVNKQTLDSNNNAEGLELLLQKQRDISYEKPKEISNASSIQKADRNCSLFEFFSMVSKVISISLKDLNVEFIPEDNLDSLLEMITKIDHPYITYKVVRRETKGEFKPRFRQAVDESSDTKDRIGEIYGQQFKSIVQFNVLATSTDLAETVLSRFEDMMLTYTGYFKKNGVTELLFHQQITDSDYNSFRQKLSVRNLQYQVDTEKLTIMFKEKIREIEFLLNQKEEK